MGLGLREQFDAPLLLFDAGQIVHIAVEGRGEASDFRPIKMNGEATSKRLP